MLVSEGRKYFVCPFFFEKASGPPCLPLLYFGAGSWAPLSILINLCRLPIKKKKVVALGFLILQTPKVDCSVKLAYLGFSDGC